MGWGRSCAIACAAVVVVHFGLACGEAYEAEPPTGNPNDGSSDVVVVVGNDGGDGSATTCGTLICGAHEICGAIGDTPTCVCAPSYARVAEKCVWTNPILDPGFQNDPAGSWAVTGGAAFGTTASPKSISPGIVEFPNEQCHKQRVSQTVSMPAYTDAEPLALRVSRYFTTDAPPVLFVGLNGRFLEPASTDPICLGERAFGGGALTVQFQAMCFIQGEYGPIVVDHATIEPEPSCPPLRTIVNGDFEANGGWVAQGALAEISPNAGTGGSRAGHLATTASCNDRPQLSGIVSIPTHASLPGVALSMSVRGTLGKRLGLGLRGAPFAGGSLGTILGTGTFEEVHVCMPEWSLGLVDKLTFRLFPTGIPPCEVQDFLIDDLRFVSDSACAPNVVQNGGFEDPNPANVWSTRAGRFDGSPHQGSRSLVLATNSCAPDDASQTVTIPDAVDGAGGPQLRFWYQTSGSGAVSFDAFPSQESLPLSDVWRAHQVCLEPNHAGRPMHLTFKMRGSPPSCGPANLLIDDVAIVHDPACPQ